MDLSGGLNRVLNRLCLEEQVQVGNLRRLIREVFHFFIRSFHGEQVQCLCLQRFMSAIHIKGFKSNYNDKGNGVQRLRAQYRQNRMERVT